MYRKNKQNQSKINILLKQESKLFHTADLALLWGVTNKNTLYTTIKRYLKKRILIPIHKGFYAVVELEKINPVELGAGFLRQYAYLSCESVLAEAGIIVQSVSHFTLVSGRSQKFKIGENSYISRQMKPEYLFQTYGIVRDNGIFRAEPARAVADLRYFNPKYHFNAGGLIDWEKVKFIEEEVFLK